MHDISRPARETNELTRRISPKRQVFAGVVNRAPARPARPRMMDGVSLPPAKFGLDVETPPKPQLSQDYSKEAYFIRSKPPKTKKNSQLDKPNRKKYSWQQIALMAAGASIFIIGISVSFIGHKINQQVEAQTKNQNQSQNSEHSGDNPDESDPGDIRSYSVNPNLPRRITIDKLKINARIVPLSTKSDGELKAPSNIHNSGWYETSAGPGEVGAMLVNGHVHGPTRPGVFSKLKNLAAGDIIEIERGDKKVFKYQVVSAKTYDRNNVDMAAAITPVEAGKSGLNLITCTGKLEKGENTYSERLIVFASLIE